MNEIIFTPKIIRNKTSVNLMCWSRRNKLSGQLLLISLKLLLYLTTFAIGVLLFTLHIRLPYALSFLASLWGLFAFVSYAKYERDIKKDRSKQKLSTRKTYELLLVLSIAVNVIFLSNNLMLKDFTSNTLVSANTVENHSIQNIFLSPEQPNYARFDTKNFISAPLVTLQSAIINGLQKTNANNWGWFFRTLLTILLIAIVGGVSYFLAILACSLSCSGQETLALVVVVVGSLIILSSLVYIIISWFKYIKALKRLPYKISKIPTTSIIALLILSLGSLIIAMSLAEDFSFVFFAIAGIFLLSSLGATVYNILRTHKHMKEQRQKAQETEQPAQTKKPPNLQ